MEKPQDSKQEPENIQVASYIPTHCTHFEMHKSWELSWILYTNLAGTSSLYGG